MTLPPKDRIKVLVADDERDLVEVIAMQLEAAGAFLVAKAYDGQQAVDSALRFLPQVVLMDKIMPVMDGWEACRRLRTEAATKSAGIILMSAEIAPASEKLALEAGADLFMPKPYERDVLVGLLKALATSGRS